MAFNKKGKRKIIVNEQTFYWSLSFDYYIPVPALCLSVMTEEKTNSRLSCYFNYSQSLDNWIITPKVVRQSIDYAIKKGWRPNSKESFFLEGMDEKLGIKDKVVFVNTYSDLAMWILRQDKSQKLKAFNFCISETPNSYTAFLIGSAEHINSLDDLEKVNEFVSNPKHFEFPKVFIKDREWQKFQDDLMNLIHEFMKSKYLKISLLSKAERISISFENKELKRIV